MNNYNNPNPQNNPQYGQPAAPQYPQQPQQYAQPAQPQYAQPAQPQYAQPQQPQQYAQPAAPTYAAPAYTAPAAPAAAPAKAGNPVLVPFIVSLISSIMMVVSLFMPYADISGFGANISFSLMDLAMGADSVSSFMGSDAEGFIVFILILLVFFGLTILFAALKKPIPQMIFAIISFLIMAILSLVVSEMTMGNFPFGFGVYFFYIMAIGSIVGSILMMVAKKKAAAAAAPAPAMPY